MAIISPLKIKNIATVWQLSIFHCLKFKKSIALLFKSLCQIGVILFALLFCSVAYGELDVNKSFSPAVITAKEVSTVTIKLLNSSLEPASQTNVTDILPDNVFIADVPDVSTTCGSGTVTYSNSAVRGELSLTDGVVPAGDGTNAGSCTVTINVYPATKGTFVNTINAGDATAMNGLISVSNNQSAEATLVAILSDVTGSLLHSIGSIQGGEVITTTITLNNSNDVDLTGTAFDLDLGSVLTAVDGTAETNCTDGSVTLTGSAGIYPLISFVDGTIPANGSCTISFKTTSARPITDAYGNTSPYVTIPLNAISTNEGATNSELIRRRIKTYSGITMKKYFNGSDDTELELVSGNTAELTITLINYNIVPVTDFDLTDIMPTSGATGVMSIESIDANTCGGVASHTSTSLTLTGATLEAVPEYIAGIQTATCTVTATVSINGVGTYINEIPAGDLSGFNYDDTDATLTAVSNAISISKGFTNKIFYQGDRRTLVYTFKNNTDISTGVDITSLAFDDEFETTAKFFIPPSPNVSTSCSDAVVTATPYSQLVSVSNLSVPKGTTCTLSVDVEAATDAYPLQIKEDYIPVGDITYVMNGVGQVHGLAVMSEASLRAGMSITKSFSPETVAPLGVTRLAIRLRHLSYTQFGVDQVSFSDVLPDGHVIASPAKAVNECGGTLVAIPGTDTISLSDGVLAAGESVRSCYVYVNVQVPALSDGASIEVSTNKIPGVAHGVTPLNYTGRRVGYPDGYDLMENYSAAAANITRQATSVAVNKEFLPISVNGGGVSRVRITFSNLDPAAIDLTGVALTDNFTGTDLRLHTDIDPTFTDDSGSTEDGCRGGNFTGASGDRSITLEDAIVDKDATCRMEFNVTANVGGNHINSIDIGDVSSLEGVSNDVSASTTLTVGRQVNVGKGFVPSTIAEDETSVLTLEIFNTNEAKDEEGAATALIDEMPAGLSVDSIISNSCGGSVSIGTQNGNDTVTLSGGSFLRASTCEVKAQVSGSSGVYTNTIAIADLMTVSGTYNADPAEATLTIVEKPTIVKSFSPSVIAVGDTSTVTLRLYNPNSAVDFTGASLTDTLTNMVIATPPAVGGTCSDVEYTAVIGSNLFTLTDASIPARKNCTVTFEVVSTVAGSHDNQTSGLSVEQTVTPGLESNVAVLTVAVPLALTKTFSPDPISRNGVSQLSFTLTNPNASEIEIGATGFTDTFPTSPGNMMIASPANISNTCGSDVVNLSGDAAASGDIAIQITGGNVPANGSCSISMDVEVDEAGTYNNTTSTLSTTGGITPAASDTLTVELVRTISGSVKNDDNGDGTGDTGIESVSVGLFNLDGSPVQVDGADLTTTTDAAGQYSFTLAPGNYIVESVDKAGYLSVSDTDGANDNKITVDTTSNDSIDNDFVDSSGFAIRGRVYNDKNADGVNDSDEIGVTDLPVVLLDVVNNKCISARTDGQGNYTFLAVPPGDYKLYEASREKVSVPNNCDETKAKDPAGYFSTTPNVLDQFSVVDADIAGKDFGDAKPPVFEPDHSGQILPGNVLFYAHKFATPTAGSVSFNNAASGNRSSGWSSILYQDVNCDGSLNQSDASSLIIGSFAVNAGDSICIINKIHAPSNVAANDSYIQQIEATFSYGSVVNGTRSLKVQDVTTAQQIQEVTSPATPEVAAETATSGTSAVDATPTTPYTPATDPEPEQLPVAATPVEPEVGPSRLELRKTVRNVTATSAETSTVNTADPGDILEYRIYYRNSGTGPVTDLVINDTVPDYTELYGSVDCGVLLADMNCVISPYGSTGSLQWTFSGSLIGGSGSSVSYQVVIHD